MTEQSEALPIVGIGRRPLEIRHLGRVGYRQAANLQIELVHERREGLIRTLMA